MKFECKQCGECCKNLGSREDLKFLPLYEWEAEEYKKIAQEKNISLNIKPISFFLDKKSGIVLCSLYGLFNDPCLFLENNKCSIYEKRALVCRQFPIFSHTGFDGKFGADCFFKCENFDSKRNFEDTFKIGSSIMGKDREDYLINTYGKETYDSAVQSKVIAECIHNVLKKLLENKKIKMRKVNELDLDKYQVMPLFDFLVMQELISLKGKEDFINRFKPSSS